jgi:hypothetical protein
LLNFSLIFIKFYKIPNRVTNPLNSKKSGTKKIKFPLPKNCKQTIQEKAHGKSDSIKINPKFIRKSQDSPKNLQKA